MAVEEVKRRSAKVKEAIIESKDQRWHCRNRVTLVFGSNDIEELDTYVYTKDSIDFKKVNFHQAKSKAIEEILDNCIDEFYRGHVSEIHVNLSSDAKVVTVQDNGIGFPLAKIKDVYTEFRTGSKFKDEEVDEKGFLYRTLGQNGLGASATCLTSDMFKATIRHYNSKKEQTFEFLDGALQIKKTKEKPFKGPSGVKVELTLAKEVYKNQVVDKELLRKRIIDLAYNNPGLTFYFNDEKYLYKKGLFELAQRIDASSAQLIGDEGYTYETTNIKGAKVKAKYDIHVSVTFDKRSDEKERMISFVNSTPTYDGGFHHDRIKRLYINTVKDKLERTAKKDKLTLVDNDVLAGMTFIIGIVMPNPRFESQTKRKLVRDALLEKALETFMNDGMAKFMRKNQELLDHIMERAKSRQRLMDLKDASKLAKKGKKQRVEKLLDANERKDRTKCALFICEGDSAIGGLRSARDKLYQGGIALKGKPMNVSQASIKEVLENQEFADIMSSIGLAIGQKPDPKELRYSKIVFLADSDVDGGHINTLLTNFFFTFWPEMFEMGMIQIAKAPLFEVVTDKGTIYCESEPELEKLKNRKDVKIKEIMRNKGLGEMSQEAFKHVLNRKDFTKISVKDMGASKNMLETCFGKESQLRKDLLIDSDEIDVDLTNVIAGVKAQKKKAAREGQSIIMKDSNQALHSMAAVPLEALVKEEYRTYQIYTLMDRAIPYLQDGLKPSQRRILFTLWKNSNKGLIKVSSLTGLVLTLHPHGPASVEQSIVNLAQDYTFSNNYPLIDKKGYFGERMETQAAAARYIECKLGKVAELLLFDDMNQVQMVPNYDEKVMEPVGLLPKLPIMLLNGAEGIGTGFSSVIPSFNHDEIIKSMISFVETGKIKKIKPYFRYYTEKVETDEKARIITKMSFKQVGEKIFITEVPKGYDAQKIYRHLNKHMDNDFLKDYIDSSVDNVINIELIFKRGQTPELSEVEKVMGVSSSIVPNYTLITEKGVKVFHTVEEILEVFTVQRLAITKRRYELLIKDYEDRLTKNNEIIRFIREKHYAIAEKKANRKDYIDYLTKQKFTYAEYLADMAIYRMTKEEVEKRQLLIKEETTALNDFRKVLKSPEQIKKKLIEELEDTGKKLTAIMNEKEAEKKRNFHKAKTTQPKTKQ